MTKKTAKETSKNLFVGFLIFGVVFLAVTFIIKFFKYIVMAIILVTLVLMMYIAGEVYRQLRARDDKKEPKK